MTSSGESVASRICGPFQLVRRFGETSEPHGPAGPFEPVCQLGQSLPIAVGEGVLHFAQLGWQLVHKILDDELKLGPMRGQRRANGRACLVGMRNGRGRRDGRLGRLVCRGIDWRRRVLGKGVRDGI